jgi:ubiquinone/menaquinone biosynthesis C-methylase UbiE
MYKGEDVKMNYHADQKRLTDTKYEDANKLDLRNEIQDEYGSHPAPWFQWLFSYLDLPENARILEIGCGSGMLWQENKGHISSGWKCFLSDLSHIMVKVSQNNLEEVPAAAGFLSLDSQTIPFPSESFDAVLAIGVLDQIPNLEKALSETWRVLRPSGQFFASAGGYHHLLEMREMLKPFVSEEQAELLGGNDQRFGLENGKKQLQSHFEEVLRHDYLDRLRFAELQPILDYVLSEEAVVWDMKLNHLSQFVHLIKEQLKEEGHVGVAVQKCLFVARKKIMIEN